MSTAALQPLHILWLTNLTAWKCCNRPFCKGRKSKQWAISSFYCHRYLNCITNVLDRGRVLWEWWVLLHTSSGMLFQGAGSLPEQLHPQGSHRTLRGCGIHNHKSRWSRNSRKLLGNQKHPSKLISRIFFLSFRLVQLKTTTTLMTVSQIMFLVQH